MRTSLALVLCLAIPAAAQTLRVVPPRALADAPVKIIATGLRPSQSVVIRATARDASGDLWQSSQAFHADARGRIESHSMDLFTSMSGKGRFNTSGLSGYRVAVTLEGDGRALAEAAVYRDFTARHVSRTDVRNGSLVGTLFEQARPVGAVLVIGGSEGGIGDEQTAAVLAGHRLTSFAVAYFGIDPLPRSLREIPLETFFHAIDYLEHKAGTKRISIVGTSKGAEAAMLVAARRDDVDRVVLFAPSSVVWSCICDSDASSWTENGKPLVYTPPGRDPSYKPAAGTPITPAVNYLYRLQSSPPEARIPHGHAVMMFIAGDDDSMWPSAQMAAQVARNGDQVVIARGAGHLIPKAYLPGGATVIANGRIETGGNAAANSRAFETAWPQVLRFLTSRLSGG